jgi:predicted nucleic acid-binding protein
MTLVLDTSIVVDILRALPAALDFARTLEERPTCSEVTRVEILRGVRSGERAATERLLATLSWVGVDETIARSAGEIGRTCGQSHPGIGLADLVIAATVQELGASMATGNVKHFPMFPGLRPPYES